jgi:hypothetical protein
VAPVAGGPVDRWIGGTGGSVAPVDGGPVDRWHTWRVDRWIGGTGGRYTGGSVAPVDSASMAGGPVDHRHRCIPNEH